MSDITVVARRVPLEIEWESKLKNEAREVVQTCILKWVGFLPPDLQQLAVIRAKAEDDKSVAHAFAEPQYRHGRIEITANFMDQSPIERERTVLHEIFHVAWWAQRAETHNFVCASWDDPDEDPGVQRFYKAYDDNEDREIQALVLALIPYGSGD